jgi:hypothetical protein
MAVMERDGERLFRFRRLFDAGHCCAVSGATRLFQTALSSGWPGIQILLRGCVLLTTGMAVMLWNCFSILFDRMERITHRLSASSEKS